MQGAASAAADCDDDFEPVTVGERVRGELAARHDFAVALDRDAFAGETEASTSSLNRRVCSNCGASPLMVTLIMSGRLLQEPPSMATAG